jgi:plastocyanin
MNRLVVGLAFMFAACGGGDQQADAPAADPAAAPPAAPATGTGATHDVNMVLEGTVYKFVPDQLTIKSGDQVVWHNVSGGPHNVQFWADSIPAGAKDVLNAAMANRIGDLNGELLVEPNAAYTTSFAGTPPGEYKYTCTPHMALGMHAKLTVQ